MADDLIHRLRERANTHAALVGYERQGSHVADDLLNEAADEIERLRQYAERLIQRLDRCPDETRAIDAELAERK